MMRIIKIMTPDLFENSLATKLNAEGYVAVSSFGPSTLSEGLVMLGITYASGLYTEICVLPADKALEGSRCKPVNYETLVYAKINRFGPKSVHVVMLECLVDEEERKFVQL